MSSAVHYSHRAMLIPGGHLGLIRSGEGRSARLERCRAGRRCADTAPSLDPIGRCAGISIATLHEDIISGKDFEIWRIGKTLSRQSERHICLRWRIRQHDPHRVCSLKSKAMLRISTNKLESRMFIEIITGEIATRSSWIHVKDCVDTKFVRSSISLSTAVISVISRIIRIIRYLYSFAQIIIEIVVNPNGDAHYSTSI